MRVANDLVDSDLTNGQLTHLIVRRAPLTPLSGWQDIAITRLKHDLEYKSLIQLVLPLLAACQT
jgi:hypothetical protein